MLSGYAKPVSNDKSIEHSNELYFVFLSEIVCFALIFVEEIILGEDRTTEEERMHIMEG